jgi:hypothetical protein
MECSPTLLPSDDVTVSSGLRWREAGVKLRYTAGLVAAYHDYYIPLTSDL